MKTVKRSGAYRAYRCYLSDHCPLDVWSSGSNVFVVFPVFLGTFGATHLAFVLHARTRGITGVKMMRWEEDAVQAWTADRLPRCEPAFSNGSPEFLIFG